MGVFLHITFKEDKLFTRINVYGKFLVGVTILEKYALRAICRAYTTISAMWNTNMLEQCLCSNRLHAEPWKLSAWKRFRHMTKLTKLSAVEPRAGIHWRHTIWGPCQAPEEAHEIIIMKEVVPQRLFLRFFSCTKGRMSTIVSQRLQAKLLNLEW